MKETQKQVIEYLFKKFPFTISLAYTEKNNELEEAVIWIEQAPPYLKSLLNSQRWNAVWLWYLGTCPRIPGYLPHLDILPIHQLLGQFKYLLAKDDPKKLMDAADHGSLQAMSELGLLLMDDICHHVVKDLTPWISILNQYADRFLLPGHLLAAQIYEAFLRSNPSLPPSQRDEFVTKMLYHFLVAEKLIPFSSEYLAHYCGEKSYEQACEKGLLFPNERNKTIQQKRLNLFKEIVNQIDAPNCYAVDWQVLQQETDHYVKLIENNRITLESEPLTEEYNPDLFQEELGEHCLTKYLSSPRLFKNITLDDEAEDPKKHYFDFKR